MKHRQTHILLQGLNNQIETKQSSHICTLVPRASNWNCEFEILTLTFDAEQAKNDQDFLCVARHPWEGGIQTQYCNSCIYGTVVMVLALLIRGKGSSQPVTSVVPSQAPAISSRLDLEASPPSQSAGGCCEGCRHTRPRCSCCQTSDGSRQMQSLAWWPLPTPPLSRRPFSGGPQPRYRCPLSPPAAKLVCAPGAGGIELFHAGANSSMNKLTIP